MTATPTTTGPPDVIGVGTQRSGTSWWFGLLLTHPRVIGPQSRAKELHWFWRFAQREMTATDIAAYHAKFPRRPGEVVVEWTPRYLHDFWTPRLIRRAAPDAKLLVLLRNPLERLRSGVPKELAVDREHRKLRPYRDVVSDAIDRGRYAAQLRRLRAGHPDAQVLVLQFERCMADPAGEWLRTLEFLGLEQEGPPPDFRIRRGGSQDAHKRDLWPELRAAVRAALADDVLELARMVPEFDLSLWHDFADLADEARGHAAVR